MSKNYFFRFLHEDGIGHVEVHVFDGTSRLRKFDIPEVAVELLQRLDDVVSDIIVEFGSTVKTVVQTIAPRIRRWLASKVLLSAISQEGPS
jgi:hypothetical protein